MRSNLFRRCGKWLDGPNGKITTRLDARTLLWRRAKRSFRPLDWANTRRTFDGLRGCMKKGEYSIDGVLDNVRAGLPNELDYR